MNNTQLPTEVVKEIKAKATAYMHAEVKGMTADEELQPHHLKYAHEAGATEYASKLHFSEESNRINLDEIGNLSRLIEEKDNKLQQAQQEIESLTSQLKNHSKVSDENTKLLRQESEDKDLLIEMYNVKHNKARTLLEKVYNDFIGATEMSENKTDRKLFKQIKQFLDGK